MMKKFHASITVTLRTSILDVQGKTVEHALHGLGFQDLSHLRIGRHVELDVVAGDAEQARERVEAACRQLIANPIMEDVRIHLEEVAAEVHA